MFGNDIVHQQAWEIVRALHRSKASAVVDLRSLTATCSKLLVWRIFRTHFYAASRGGCSEAKASVAMCRSTQPSSVVSSACIQWKASLTQDNTRHLDRQRNDFNCRSFSAAFSLLIWWFMAVVNLFQVSKSK